MGESRAALKTAAPGEAAQLILAAMQRDRRRAVIGPDAKVVDFVSRLQARLSHPILEKGGKTPPLTSVDDRTEAPWPTS